MPPPLLGIFGRLKPSEVLTPSISWAASKNLFLAEEGCGGRRPGRGHSVVLTAADRAEHIPRPGFPVPEASCCLPVPLQSRPPRSCAQWKAVLCMCGVDSEVGTTQKGHWCLGFAGAKAEVTGGSLVTSMGCANLSSRASGLTVTSYSWTIFRLTVLTGSGRFWLPCCAQPRNVDSDVLDSGCI